MSKTWSLSSILRTGRWREQPCTNTHIFKDLKWSLGHCQPFTGSPMLAPKGCKHTIKHICTDLEAGCASTRTYIKLLVPDSTPAPAEESRFMPSGTGDGRGWWDGVLGVERGHFWGSRTGGGSGLGGGWDEQHMPCPNSHPQPVLHRRFGFVPAK